MAGRPRSTLGLAFSVVALLAGLLQGLVDAQLVEVQVSHPRMPIAGTSFYDSTMCPLYGGADDPLGPPAALDNNAGTFIHTGSQHTRNFYRLDLGEPRAITRIRLQGRGDCCTSRDDDNTFWISNSANFAFGSEAVAIRCSQPGPFSGPGAWRESVCSREFFPARYVYIVRDCGGALYCWMNWASLVVFALAPTLPVVYVEILQGKPANMISAWQGGSTTTWAGYGVDGDLTTIMHNRGGEGVNVLWWRADTGNPDQPIDRVAVLNRRHYVNCIRYWMRDDAQDVAFSSGAGDLTFDGATPTANKCGQTGYAPVPWQWQSVQCRVGQSAIGRYVWLRGVNGFSTRVCRVGDLNSCWTGENYMQVTEVQAYSSRCPSFRSMVGGLPLFGNPAAYAFSDGFSSGCGNSGTLSSAFAWSGSRCTPTCAAGFERIAGGASGAVTECRQGEWVDVNSRAALGPVVCGKTCPAIPGPALSDVSACVQTVVSLDFKAGQNTIDQWFPTWKVFRATAPADLVNVNDLGNAITYAEAEMRARVVPSHYTGVLWLTGKRTLFALNNPFWASTPQVSSWLSITADVTLDTNSAEAGLALRVKDGDPAASFYLLKLRIGSGSHRFVRVDAGVETDLGATLSNCNIARSSGRRVRFMHSGTTLRATCDGVFMGSVEDASSSRLLTGSAGLWNSDAPGYANQVGEALISFFDNVLVQRQCSGSAADSCDAAGPDGQCTFKCIQGNGIAGTKATVTCRADGTWDGTPLQCGTTTTSAGPFSVQENSLRNTNVGNPITVSNLPDGATVNYTLLSTSPPGAPFAIGNCDGQIKVSRPNSLDFEGGPQSYTLSIQIDITGTNYKTTSTISVAISVTDVPEAPTLPATTTITVPENAAVGAAFTSLQCTDVDGLPLTATIVSNAGTGFFNLTRTFPAATTMPNAGAFSLVFAGPGGSLDYEAVSSWTLVVVCKDATGLTATGILEAAIGDVAEPPVFSRASLNLTIAENATALSTAAPALEAVDPERGVVTYALANGATSAEFTVTPLGLIQLKSGVTLDFERQKSYTLPVTATDPSGLVATANAFIRVLDVNERPTFDNLTRTIREDAVPFTAIGAVLNATDPEDKVMTYAIVGPVTGTTVPNGLFTIEGAQLRLGNTMPGSNLPQLDFFSRAWYALLVSASDAGTPDGRITTVLAMANISVQWVNQAPTLAANTGCTVPENSALNTNVCDIVATDRDTRPPINDQITYSIVSQDATTVGDLAPFAINPSTGRITVSSRTGSTTLPARLDFETLALHRVTVKATDASGAFATQTYTIRLSNVNEQVSLPTGISFSAKQRTVGPVGTALSTLVVDQDLQAGKGERFTFSITAGNTDSTFSIDSQTGQISAVSASATSFFAPTEYFLTIAITDAAIDGAATSTTGTVRIVVIDNNTPPSCSAVAGTVLMVAERAAHGTAVGTLTCTDAEAPQQTLTYRLDSAGQTVNRPFPFKINPTTGAITVDSVTAGNGVIDFEGLFSFYNATLTATDSHVNAPLLATASISIIVQDRQEPPYFSPDPLATAATGNPGAGRGGMGVFNLTLAENAAGGTALINKATGSAAVLTAQDQDAADNVAGALTYSWAPSVSAADAALFAISSVGAITVAGSLPATTALDFETRPLFSLSLRVTDSAGNTDVATVFISLSDVNENPQVRSPAFALAFSHTPTAGPLVVSEDAAVGTHLGSVRGFDVDAGISGFLTYSINGSTDDCTTNLFASGAFAIDPRNGTISVAKAGVLDWEDCVSAILSVVITDGGAPIPGSSSLSPGLSKAVLVPISITDAADVVITSARLFTGDEAAGRGVDYKDEFSLLTAQYPSPSGTAALFSTDGGARLVIVGSGLGVTPNRIAKAGAGNAPTVAISATFGPASARTRYSTGPCTVHLTGYNMTCVVPAGTGAGHEWRFTVTISGAAATQNLVVPSTGVFTTGYMRPTLLNVAKQGTTAGQPAPASQQLLSTRGGESLIVTAKNAGPVGSLVTLVSALAVPMTEGDSSAAFQTAVPRYQTAPCAWGPSGAYLLCVSVAGIGSGLGWQISVDGQSSGIHANASVKAYSPPLVTGASVTASTAVNSILSTQGGETFNVTGDHFGPVGTSVIVRLSMGELPASLTAGPLRPPASSFPVYTATHCVVQAPGHSLISCRSPEAVGSRLFISVTAAGQTSALTTAAAVSYRAPVITAVGGMGASGASTKGGAEILLVVDQAGPATPLDADVGMNSPSFNLPAMAGYSLPLALYGRPPSAALAGSSLPQPNALSGVLNSSATWLRYTARVCRVTVAHSLVSCALAEGTGGGHLWAVVIGGQISPVSLNSSSYGNPIVASYENKGADSATTAGSEPTDILGSNFGPVGTVITATYTRASGAAGVASNGTTAEPVFTATNCVVITPHEKLRCLTAPGAGKGLSWSLVVDGLRSVFPTTSYLPPSIATISGPGSPGDSTEASTEGGQNVTLTGTDFAASTAFLDGVTFGPSGTEFVAVGCAVTTPHTAITCVLPPGTGRRLRWIVTVAGQRSPLSPVETASTSYERPRITLLTPTAASLGPTVGGTQVTVKGTGFALRSARVASTVTVYVETGYSTVSRPAQVDIDRYFAALQAGSPPPEDVRDAMLAWIASLDRPPLTGTSQDAGSVSFRLPVGFGTSRRLFVSVAGVPSDAVLFSYSAPFLSNAAIDRRGMPSGKARLTVDGSSFCRDTACGSLLLDGVPFTAAPVNWTHSQITTVVDLPPSGTRRTVQVTVDSQASNFASFSNPAPSFPSGLTEQRTYVNMLTQGGQQVIIDGVSELQGIADDSITIQIGESKNGTCVNVTKTLQSGSSPTDPAALWRLTGISPQGVGASLFVYVRVLDSLSPRADGFRFSYAAPSLTSLAPPPAPGRRQLQSQSSPALPAVFAPGGVDGIPCSGMTVQLQGTNLGTSELTTAQIIVILPPASLTPSGTVDETSAARVQGAVTVVSHTHTRMLLAIPPGQGAGLSLFISIGEQMSAPLLFGFRSPSVLSVSPSTGPTMGNTIITVVGSDWGVTTRPRVTIGGVECLLVGAYVPNPSAANSSLTCLTPAGVGAGLPVVVTIGGQTSVARSPQARFSYLAPIVSSVSPSSGPTSGRDAPTEMVSATGAVSFIPGQRRIMQVLGSNFGGPETLGLTSVEFLTTAATMEPGAGGDSLLPGSRVALVRGADLINKTHTSLTFYAPEGAGAALTVRVIVASQPSVEATLGSSRFDFSAPSVRAWRRADRPPAACAPVVRRIEVALPRLATLFAGVGVNVSSPDVVASLIARGSEIALAPGLNASFATAQARAANGTLATVARVYPAGCYEVRGGFTLEIIGDSFAGRSLAALAGPLALPAVFIGGMPCPLADIASLDHNRLICTVPPGMGDSLPIVVSVLGRSSDRAMTGSTPFSFDPPELIATSPSTPDANGGRINLKGRNFGGMPNEVSITIGGKICEEATWLNDGLLQCLMAPLPVGPANLTVVAANRTSAYMVYEFEPAAVVAECRKGSYGLVTETCLECPTQGVCPGGEQEIDLLTAGPGVWRSNTSLADARCHPQHPTSPPRQPWGCPLVEACSPPESCLGNNLCLYGYVGDRCSECLPGKFYRVDSECVKCPDSMGLVITLAVVGIVLIALGAWWFSKKGLSVTLVSIGIDYFQVLSLFARVKVRWPPEIISFLRSLAAFNLGIEIVAPACLNPGLQYWQTWSAIEALPVLLLSVFALALGAKVLFKVLFRNVKKAKLLSHAPGMIAASIMLFRLLYLQLTRTSLDPLTCLPLMPSDGKTYLGGLITYPCWTSGPIPVGTQLILFPIGLATLLVYSIGLPFLAWWKLRTARRAIYVDQILRCRGSGDDRLSNPYYTTRRALGKLYAHLKPAAWYWELVVVARKGLLAVILVVFRGSASYQLALSLLVLFAAFVVQSQVRPYLGHSARQQVLEDHQKALLTNPLAAQADAEIKALEIKNKRNYRSQRNLFAANTIAVGGKGSSQIVIKAVVGVVDYNTVEGVLLISAILVCLSGLMFQSERFSPLFLPYYIEEYRTLAAAIITLISLTIIFYLIALLTDFMFVLTPATAAMVCSRTASCIGSSVDSLMASTGGKNKSGLGRPRQAVRINGGAGSSSSSSSDGFTTKTSGGVELSLNPLLNSAASVANPKKDKNGNVLSPADIATMSELPDTLTWQTVQASFVDLQRSLETLSAENKSLKTALENSQASATSTAAAALTMRGRSRQQFNPVLSADKDTTLDSTITSGSASGGGGALGVSPQRKAALTALGSFKSSKASASSNLSLASLKTAGSAPSPSPGPSSAAGGAAR